MRQAYPTFGILKLIMVFVSGFISPSTSAQSRVHDSVLYELTSRTIEDYDKLNYKKLRVIKSVAIPVELWDENTRTARTGAYFTSSDLPSITNQILNPAIKTWDAISEMTDIKLVNKIDNRECLIISLPIVSTDGNQIVIYYKSVTRRSGAGFVTVWIKNESGAWIKKKETMLWITSVMDDSLSNKS